MATPSHDEQIKALDLESKKLALEMQQLEYIDLKNRVQKIKDQAQRQAVTHQTVEDALADKDRQTKNRQEACTHRKGGKGYEGLCGNGQDSMYAIARHRMANGEIIVLCLRCQKVWDRKDAEYNQALRFPTDNEMSESCQFSITKH